MPLVESLAQSITRMENTNPSYNNPGGIWNSSTNSIKRYATYEQGYQALLNTINAKIGRGYNLYQFFAEYAPAGHGANDPTHYAENVSGWIGVDPSVKLNSVASGVPTNSNNISTSMFSTDVYGLMDNNPVSSIVNNISDSNESLPWIIGVIIGGLIMTATD